MPKTNLMKQRLPRVCRKGAGGALTINLTAYGRRLRARLDEYLALMAEHWGFRPDLQVHLTVDVLARVDFNLMGFAHQGRRIQVKAEHAEGRHSPERVARQLVAELVEHRNTCDRCGEGLPALRQRADYGTNSYAGRNPWIWYTDAAGRLRSRPARADELALFDRPPDPVERAVLPGQARRLDKRLQAKAEAEVARKEAKAKESEYENVFLDGVIQIGAAITVRCRSDGQQLAAVIKELRVEAGRLVADVELVEYDCAVRRRVVLAPLATLGTETGGDNGEELAGRGVPRQP